jgi:glycyl-tRNA synthetase beta chain
MRFHQKYFSVESKDGKLVNKFVAVTNTDGDPEGLIRHGNERVLRARFNDARFFWDADQKKPLADRVEDLENVTFQAKLGTYREKTERVKELVGQLGGDENAIRAAHLAKADLTTELVKEFTELQGIIGGLYAEAQGEPEEVAHAIYDHYRPAGMDDAIPRNRAGQLLSIADKLDTLQGCFQIGLIPTGSKDPLGLRRAAQGIVRVIVEGGLRDTRISGASVELQEFFLDRIRYYFREIKNYPYDEVNAVIASGHQDLTDVADRLEAIRAVRPTPNFEPVAAAFKRIRNILRQAGDTFTPGPIDSALLEPGPETELYKAFQREQAAAAQTYREKLESVARLRPEIDLFFDKVMVNAPDPAVRQNRLTLLQTMLAEFSTIADFSEIVTSSQENK